MIISGGHMKYVKRLLVFLCFCSSSLAYINIDTAGVKKAVVFIYSAKANGDVDERPGAPS